MGRIKSFMAGVLFCLIGVGLISVGMSNTFKRFLRILEEENNPTTKTLPQQPSNPETNTKIIVDSDNDNHNYANDNLTQPSAEPKPPIFAEPNATNNNQNFDQFVLPKNQPVGKLGAVHGIGGAHLTNIPTQYTQKNEQIHKRVLNPTLALIHAAQEDGIRLFVVSAFRSYSHQKSIWERKWGDAPDNDVNKAKEILRFSSYPGTSRHHWGTDIDFNSVSLSYWETNEGQRIHNWLKKNAPNYGFCQTYAPGRSGGYSNEPWHWSHMPTANAYHEQINNPQVFALVLAQNVKGSQAVNEMGSSMMTYVRSISHCNYSSAPVAPVKQVSPPINKNKITSLEPISEPKPKKQQQLTDDNPKPKLGKTPPCNIKGLHSEDYPANECLNSNNDNIIHQPNIKQQGKIHIESVEKDANGNPKQSFSN